MFPGKPYVGRGDLPDTERSMLVWDPQFRWL